MQSDISSTSIQGDRDSFGHYIINSPRHTMDIDYVFVPFSSKKEILDRIDTVLHEIEGAVIAIKLHSKMVSAELHVDGAAIQIEANVATECEAVLMATGGFAQSVGHPSQIVRVMNPSHALAHKIAAWNERRLLRDLYDCYFLSSRAGASPDLQVLDLRLAEIQSRLPRLKELRSMSRNQLADELRQAVTDMSDTDLEQELQGILPPEELAGLSLRIRVSVEKLTMLLTQDRNHQ